MCAVVRELILEKGVVDEGITVLGIIVDGLNIAVQLVDFIVSS